MKKMTFMLLILFVIMPAIVNAEVNSGFYTNQNGVVFEREVYDKLVNLYSKNYIETIMEEEYERISSISVDDIIVDEYSDLLPFGPSFSTSAKTVKLIKSGNYVTLMATWKGIPTIKSYDVIAVRFSGVSLNGSFTFKQTYISNNSLVTSYSSSNQQFSNGFGSSFLVGNGSGLEISLTFMVSGTGTIYGSYQHASSTTTLAQSKKYTISYLGYGGVIKFDDSVKNKYDAMTGVDLSI